MAPPAAVAKTAAAPKKADAPKAEAPKKAEARKSKKARAPKKVVEKVKRPRVPRTGPRVPKKIIAPEVKKRAAILATRKAVKKAKNIRAHITKPNKVKEVKNEIKAIKRAGGTIRFARTLKKIRQGKKDHVNRGIKKDLAKLKKSKIEEARKAVEGKFSKKGIPKKAVVRSMKYLPGKMRKIYHTQLPMRTLPSSNTFKDQNTKNRRHYAKLRKSLVPGTVCIVLGGKHKAKKVVFLKQLRRSGLCLVTGPWCLNRIPVRRMDQAFMIATSVRLELPKKFKVPVHVDDHYFKRPRVVRQKVTKAEGDVKFSKQTLKRKSGPKRERRIMQTYLDKHVMNAIKSHHDSAAIKKYMTRSFGLMGKRYAHDLKF